MRGTTHLINSNKLRLYKYRNKTNYLTMPSSSSMHKHIQGKKQELEVSGTCLSRITNVLQCFNPHRRSNGVSNTRTPIAPPRSTTLSTIRPNRYHYSKGKPPLSSIGVERQGTKLRTKRVIINLLINDHIKHTTF